ncbi:Methyltransferase domain-containing protein [Streptomyces misionensis]|uniref:Methyltransferase domain-containing protein n=1 Tax=Streptomyces misionensis TaxID=67331 RepID=A0A1H4QQ76_9ACTN|nr:class I SAM-dependent methyltransferase [Streptomyces misionensis]SEC21800.1 Methyltransferase domain-containing protein [Streptomyces misionensis]
MNAFSGTASYYRRFRPVIPDELARLLDQTAPTASPRRLLDIGTGPGTVVHALLPYFDDVIAVDADVAMLVEAEGVLRPDLPPTHRLQIRHAFAEDFVPPDGWRPQLVTCGRVFHWLDQPRFLERLDEYVAPEGIVAVFSDRSLWTASSTWQQAARTVVQEFLGEQRHAGAGTFAPPGPPYEGVLRSSAFSDVTGAVIPVRRLWTITEVVGYLYSTSFAAPHLFGNNRRAFETRLTEILGPLTDAGHLVEDNAFTVLAARRPSPSRDVTWT